MWQEPWGKVELLLVMRVDKPKSLVCHGKATFAYKPFKQFYACLNSFMLINSLIVPFSSLHVFNNNLYKKLGNK